MLDDINAIFEKLLKALSMIWISRKFSPILGENSVKHRMPEKIYPEILPRATAGKTGVVQG